MILKKIETYSKWITGILIAGLLILALFTLHDVATAQGIGLYLSVLQNNDNRVPYDIAVDICGMFLLLCVLLVPCYLLKYKESASILRFMMAYFTFMPSISMAMLVHLFDRRSLFVVSFDWQIGLNYLSTFVREVIPILIILGYFYLDKGFTLKKWHKVIFIMVLIFGFGMLFLPELSNVCVQLMYYLLILVAFDWWESWYTQTEYYERIVLWIIFGMFYCRGVLRMLELMSAYHL